MSLHCTYNTNHWPCNYCTASDPKDKNAECNFQDSKEGRKKEFSGTHKQRKKKDEEGGNENE